MDFDQEIFAKAVTKKFGRKATLWRSEQFRWPRPPTIIWDGTIYIYKLAGRDHWPHQVFVFQIPKTDGSIAWVAYERIETRRNTPQDAVKEAHRNKWAKEMGLGISN